MSGIAGVVHLDGSPIDAHVLARMTEAVAHRGPDGSGTWVNGPVGLGHRMLRTTPESLDEHQPLCDESGGVCLVLDGRVDNREELGTALEAKGISLRDRTDAELVLKSYLLWGEDAPVRILGDFSFAIWDGRHNALFCARDVFGIKPLLYHFSGNFVLIASELHQFFYDPRVRRVANEGMAAEFLSAEITHSEETLWEGILRLPAAHAMWVKSGRIEKRRYWDFDFSKEIRYRNDEDYANHFLSVFRAAIRCRMRSCGPIGSYLSGGLDSSSVSVIANELLIEQNLATPLSTFSLIFPGMSCDESKYISEIAKRSRLRSHLFQGAVRSTDYYRQQASRYQDFPGWPNGDAMFTRLHQGLRCAGTRVLLTGWGGNECMEGSSRDRIRELAQEGKLVELVRAARTEASIRATSRLRVLVEHGVWENSAPSLKRVLKPMRHDRFAWLPSEFVRRTDLISRVEPVSPERGARPVQWAIRSYIYSGWNAHFRESLDRNAAFMGREERHPFFDRRLAEFAFALSERQRSHRGVTKVLLRNALRGHLPDSVIERRVQADFAPIVAGAVSALNGQDDFSAFAIVARGWIRPDALLSWLQKVRTGNLDDLWKLWAAVGIDIWYSSVRQLFPA